MGMGGLVHSFVFLSKCLSLYLNIFVYMSLSIYMSLSMRMSLSGSLSICLAVYCQKSKKNTEKYQKMAKNHQKPPFFEFFGKKRPLYQVMRTFQNSSR